MIPRVAGGRRAGIRVRLGWALAIALAPVLVLSGLQSALIFHRDAADKKAELVGEALAAVTSTRARVKESAELLRGMAAASVGPECVSRLAEFKTRLPGFINIVRLNAAGWVTCAAAPAPRDVIRRAAAGFGDLANGRRLVVVSGSGGVNGEPAILISVPVYEAGRFSGAMTGVAAAAGLIPQAADRSTLADTQVSLAEREGRLLASAAPAFFPVDPSRTLRAGAGHKGTLWLGFDRRGEARLFAAAPLADDLFILLSAPSEGMISWARLNPLSAFVLPVVAFLLAVAAVALVAERNVVRWIVYLDRIAQLYAGGHYGVQPTKASSAPAEIGALAAALGKMASTLATREAAIKENLAAKDKMLREIHHRVKNNLQVISSLLNLQQRSLSDSAAKAAISDTKQRIVALSVIYKTLYEGSDLRHVDLHRFVDELIAQLLLENRELPSNTDLRAAPLEIDPDRLAPLALFIVEAVANVSRQPPAVRERPLTIRFAPEEGGGELTITDGAPPLEEGSLGLTLMKVFARQLRGEITYPENADGRRDARLVFPLPPV